MSTEQQTRKHIIDKALTSPGWNVTDPTQVIVEFDIIVEPPEGVSEQQTPYQGHQFSDYVLLGRDTKPLAIIEAKKPAKTRPWDGNKRSNIVTTCNGTKAANYRSVFTLTSI